MKSIQTYGVLALIFILSSCVALDKECGPWRTESIDTSLALPARISIVGQSFIDTDLTATYERQDGGRLSAEAELLLQVNGIDQQRHNLTDPQCPKPQPYVAYQWRLQDAKRAQDVLAVSVFRQGSMLFQHEIDFRPFTITGVPPELIVGQTLQLRYLQNTIGKSESLAMWVRQETPKKTSLLVQEWSVTDMQDGWFYVTSEALARLPSGAIRIWFVRSHKESLHSGNIQIQTSYSTLGSAHATYKR